MVAIAPGFTIGFVRPSTVRSIAASELNGSPVLLTPSRSRASRGPRSSQTSATTNGFDTLMIENSWSASPALKTLPSFATTATPNRPGSTEASAG